MTWRMVHAYGCTVGSPSRMWRCVPECRLVRVPDPKPEPAPLLVVLLDVVVGVGVSVYRRARGRHDEEE